MENNHKAMQVFPCEHAINIVLKLLNIRTTTELILHPNIEMQSISKRFLAFIYTEGRKTSNRIIR